MEYYQNDQQQLQPQVGAQQSQYMGGAQSYIPYLKQAQQTYMQLGIKPTATNITSLASQLQKQSMSKGLTAQQSQALRKLQAASAYLNEYEQLIAQTSPTENAVMARLSGPIKEFAGMTGISPANEDYRRYAEGSASLFLKSLGESGSLSDRDVARAQQILPSLNQSRAEVERNIARLRKMIQTNMRNVVQYGGGAEQGLQGMQEEAAQGYGTY